MLRCNNFDLIRLFAASSVLIVHAINHLIGDSIVTDILHQVPGVPIFFFVSGFLIFDSFLRSSSILAYAKKRILRIYPALYFCFLVSLLSVFAIGALSTREIYTIPFQVWVVSQLSFAQFYNLEALRGYGTGVLNGALWTISVELQFYVLTPFIAYVARTRPMALLGGGVVIFIIPNLFFLATSDGSLLSKLFMVTAMPWFYMFLTGAWLSTRPDLVHRIVRLPAWGLLTAVVCVQFIAWLVALPSGNNINPISFFVIAAFVLKLSYSIPHLSEKVLNKNDISYGVYIYHMPIINALLFFGLSGWLWVSLSWVGAVAVATCSWFMIEKPALALKARPVFGMPSA